MLLEKVSNDETLLYMTWFPVSKISCTQQLDEGSDREEKERMRDLDNNVILVL
jgi:hypothetical protein